MAAAAAAAAGEEVKLLGRWPSPYTIRTKMALNLKGVAYEFIEEGWGEKTELLLKSNPVYKRVPVLLHAGRSICESMIIIEYIDQVWASEGPSILPSMPYDRAIARFWQPYIDEKLFPSIKGILKVQKEEAKVEATEKAREALQLLEEAFKKCSKGKDFFNGDTVGYLDIALGCLLVWIKMPEKMEGITLLDEEKMPLLVGWAQRFCSVDAVKEALPDTDKLVEFTEMQRATRWRSDAPTN